MWIEETPNGKFKFCERYRDPYTGKQKKVSVTMDKQTAKARKQAFEILQGKIDRNLSATNQADLTLNELKKLYIEDLKFTCKDSTCREAKGQLNTCLAILGEDTKINLLSARYIRSRYLNSGMKPATINNSMIRLKAMLHWGYKNDYVESIQYLDKIEPLKDRRKKAGIEGKYLETHELKLLLENMYDPVWKLFTEFLCLSGLRFGEAAALENSDIDFDKNEIHVTKTYDRIGCVVTTPKTKTSIRDIYMQPELFSVCKKMQTLMKNRRLMYGLPSNELFVFSKKGKHIVHDTYNHYLKTVSEKVLGRSITAHALRHTHASLMFESGIPLDQISRRLGHESSAITRKIYLHITEKQKEKENNLMKDVKIL